MSAAESPNVPAPSDSEGITACRPNIGAAGRRRRRIFAWVIFVASGALLVLFIAGGYPAWWRLLLGIPIGTGAMTGLESRRHTCVHRAISGELEHEDFTAEKVDAAFAAASRAMARTIVRDGALLGLAGGLLAGATAFIH